MTSSSNRPISEYLSNGIKIRISKTYLHSHGHCNIIYKIPDMERTPVSVTGKLIPKENVISLCKGTSLILKKEGLCSLKLERIEIYLRVAFWTKVLMGFNP